VAADAPRRRARAAATAVGPGLLDQALASGVNFLTVILVARAVEPREFGWFALVFTLLQSLGALQIALVARPHNVLGPPLTGDDYVRFTTTTVMYQACFVAVGATALAVAGAAAGSASELGRLLLVAAPVLVVWQLQELGRRILYTEDRLGAALVNDGLSYGLQGVVFVALYARGDLDGVRALAVVGATSALAIVVAVAQLRHSLGRRLDRGAFRTLWRFGRWLGAAELAYWFESQYYIYLAAALIGPVAAGALKAGQTLLGPVSVFLAFFVNYLPIRFARRFARHPGDVAAAVREGLAITVPPVAVYGAVAAAAAPWLLATVYGDAYRHEANVVRLFALYYLCLSVSDVVVASLTARDRTRRVFGGHLAGAAASIAVGWLLVDAAGAAGAVAAMIAAIATAFAVFVSARRGAPAARREALEP
jgi:O-antigen/teichoic acid export membrane protein